MTEAEIRRNIAETEAALPDIMRLPPIPRQWALDSLSALRDDLQAISVKPPQNGIKEAVFSFAKAAVENFLWPRIKQALLDKLKHPVTIGTASSAATLIINYIIKNWEVFK